MRHAFILLYFYTGMTIKADAFYSVSLCKNTILNTWHLQYIILSPNGQDYYEIFPIKIKKTEQVKLVPFWRGVTILLSHSIIILLLLFEQIIHITHAVQYPDHSPTQLYFRTDEQN